MYTGINCANWLEKRLYWFFLMIPYSYFRQTNSFEKEDDMIKLNGIFTIVFITCFLILSCKNNTEEKMIEEKEFGKLSDGSVVTIYSLKNEKGATAKITNYGAIVVSLCMPDKNGKIEDVVFGFDSLEGYVNNKTFIGTIVGRYGNRIGKGKFKIDNEEYQVTVNDGNNHLHGGNVGFYKALWNSKAEMTADGPSVKLEYLSKDGEEGYPGNLKIQVVYTLTNNNELDIKYTATTDKPTIINPTQHSYFNISGNMEKTILDNELWIDADYYTPIDSESITTGELASVENTPFDFRKPTKIGQRINDENEQLKNGQGYDHNWVINNADGTVKKVCTLYDSESGRLMEVLSDEPGIQFYSGNFIDGTFTGRNGIKYQHRTALCLENQHYPDSPNKENFPSVRLNPGETYSQHTIYRFLIK